MWTGTGAGAPVFNMAAWQRTTDGPGSYGAELNVGGKIVYGFVWRTTDLTAGEYRLTFSLDNDAEFTPFGRGSGAAFDISRPSFGAARSWQSRRKAAGTLPWSIPRTSSPTSTSA